MILGMNLAPRIPMTGCDYLAGEMRSWMRLSDTAKNRKKPLIVNTISSTIFCGGVPVALRRIAGPTGLCL